MIPPPELIDVVSFEVPTFMLAKDLLARLRPTWWAQIDDLGSDWAVVAEFRPNGRDLAVLMRAVQAWVGGSGLGAVRIQLDARYYILEPAPAEKAVLAW